MAKGDYYYIIQPSAFCQLGCHYCGQTHTKNKLSIENQNFLVAKIIRELEARTYTGLSICWFGGEPLTGIEVIENISQQLISYCINNNLNYGAKVITNGLALTTNRII